MPTNSERSSGLLKQRELREVTKKTEVSSPLFSEIFIFSPKWV
jgi:hypothetical protein